MGTLNFFEIYRSKSDDDLMRLALDTDHLTDDAKNALSVVLASRGLASKERLDEFRKEEAHAKETEEKNIGLLWDWYGFGRRRYGKWDYGYDEASKVETFTTTAYITLLYFPVIPTGTYRIQRRKRFLSYKSNVLEKLPLNWTQILGTWAFVSVCSLLIVWSFYIWE